MNYISILFFSLFTTFLIGQNNPRANFESELQLISDKLKAETNANYEKGPMFNFEAPYLAVFTKSTDYNTGTSSNRTTVNFTERDTILILGAQPVGKVLKFKSQKSEDIFQTKAYGHPGFEVLNSSEFKTQVGKIKKSDWKQAELLATMLSCGSLESAGRPNFEKHHLNIGDTPVFFQVRLESNKILLYFDLRTYGGNDFKDMGVAEGGKSTMNLIFGDESNASIKCESDDDRFAIFDITNLKNQFLSGISRITFELSKKNVTKELNGPDKFAIGLKMECIKQE